MIDDILYFFAEIFGMLLYMVDDKQIKIKHKIQQI